MAPHPLLPSMVWLSLPEVGRETSPENVDDLKAACYSFLVLLGDLVFYHDMGVPMWWCRAELGEMCSQRERELMEIPGLLDYFPRLSPRMYKRNCVRLPTASLHGKGGASASCIPWRFVDFPLSWNDHNQGVVFFKYKLEACGINQNRGGQCLRCEC